MDAFVAQPDEESDPHCPIYLSSHSSAGFPRSLWDVVINYEPKSPKTGTDCA
jgi:hypothetical protein